jgi:Outer membrane protein beta-barrel domain
MRGICALFYFVCYIYRYIHFEEFLIMKTNSCIFLLMLLFLVPQTYGQPRRKVDPGIHFGVVGGLNIQSIIGKDYWGEKLNNDLFPGFHAGGNVILTFAPDFYVQPGILFSVKGAKQTILTDNIKKTTRLSYLEIPVNVLFRPQLGDGHLLLAAGPYAAYGIMGKERTKIGPITTELTVKYVSDATDRPTSYVYYRGLDAGANVYVGYELFNGIFCQINGQMGLLKINPDYGITDDPASKKNIGFGISAGYRF